MVRSGGIVEDPRRLPSGMARQKSAQVLSAGPAALYAAGSPHLTAKDPPKRVFCATCGGPVVRNGGWGRVPVAEEAAPFAA